MQINMNFTILQTLI